ncbi:MAG: hypothetical protein ACYSTR_08425 [Planctomycetota bacterium]|jgi:hypothetical protein
MAVSEKQLIANRQNAQKSTGPITAAGKAVSSQNATRHGLCAEKMVVPGEDPVEFDQFRDQLFQEFAPVGVLESRLTAQIAAALWKFQRTDRMESDLLSHLQDAQARQQDEYAKRVITAAQKIADAKSLADEVLTAAEISVHRVSFEEAQKQWLSTDDGMAFSKNRWPTDHEYSKPMRAFEAFWAELDQRATQSGDHRQPPPAPADNGSAEPERTDISYQVMMEQRQRIAALQQADPKRPPPADSALTPEQVPTPPEPVSWGPAMVNDFTGSNIMLKFNRYKTQSERSLYRALNELNKLQYLRKRSEAIEVTTPQEAPN